MMDKELIPFIHKDLSQANKKKGSHFHLKIMKDNLQRKTAGKYEKYLTALLIKEMRNKQK